MAGLSVGQQSTEKFRLSVVQMDQPASADGDHTPQLGVENLEFPSQMQECEVWRAIFYLPRK